MVRTILESKVPELISEGIGLSAGVIDKEECNFFSFGGIREGSSDTPDERTLYEIGSLTKVFTTTLLSDLVAQNEIELEQPVKEILVEIPSLPASITMQSLATHTSGLPRLPGNLWKSVLKDRSDPYANYTRDDLYEYLCGLRESDLTKTGSLINYSNLGMGLLGLTLAEYLGLSYEEAIQKRICQPLGLEDTTISLSQEQEARLAQPHSGSGRQTTNFSIPALPGAGALLSNANDLAEFIKAYLTPAETTIPGLSTALEIYHTEFAPESRLIQFFGKIRILLDRQPQPEPERIGIGLGWVCMRLPDSQAIAWIHDGATGGFQSFMAFVPEAHIGVIVLNNRGFSEQEVIFPRYNAGNLGLELLEALNLSDIDQPGTTA